MLVPAPPASCRSGRCERPDPPLPERPDGRRRRRPSSERSDRTGSGRLDPSAGGACAPACRSACPPRSHMRCTWTTAPSARPPRQPDRLAPVSGGQHKCDLRCAGCLEYFVEYFVELGIVWVSMSGAPVPLVRVAAASPRSSSGLPSSELPSSGLLSTARSSSSSSAPSDARTWTRSTPPADRPAFHCSPSDELPHPRPRRDACRDGDQPTSNTPTPSWPWRTLCSRRRGLARQTADGSRPPSAGLRPRCDP